MSWHAVVGGLLLLVIFGVPAGLAAWAIDRAYCPPLPKCRWVGCHMSGAHLHTMVVRKETLPPEDQEVAPLTVAKHRGRGAR